MSANTLLKGRSDRLNPFCMILTILLIHRRVNKQGIELLNNLGVTMSYNTVWKFLEKMAQEIKLNLKNKFNSNASFKKQFLVIDNVNIAQKKIGDTTGILNWTMGVVAEVYRR